MKKIYLSISALIVCAFAVAEILDDNGKAARTGSPGETTCFNGCHNSSALNSGTGSVTISCNNMPNWEYVPNTTYNLSVTVAQTGMAVFGLGFEAINNTSGTVFASIGTLTPGTGTTIKSAIVGGASRPSIVHQLNAGLVNDTKTFNFTWTSPATVPANPTITFYKACEEIKHRHYNILIYRPHK